MRQFIIILLSLIGSHYMVAEVAEPLDTIAIRQSVDRLFERYPQATLQDVYKSCFQDRLGMLHLLSDRETVSKYIVKELEADDYRQDTIYYESCGWQGNYVRVNLQAIKDNKITVEELVDAFMASAPDTIPQVTQAWIEEWEAILSVVRDVNPQLANLEADAQAISQMLERGEYVMHHSRQYNECYHPHYRIVRCDVFERDLLFLVDR